MRVTLEIANRDLYDAIGVDQDRAVDPRRGRAAPASTLLDYVAARVHVNNGEADCAPGARALSFADKSDGFFAVTARRLRLQAHRRRRHRRVRPLLRPRSDASGAGAHRAARPARAAACLPRRRAHAAPRSADHALRQPARLPRARHGAHLHRLRPPGVPVRPAPGRRGARICVGGDALHPRHRHRLHRRALGDAHRRRASAGCGCRRASWSRRSRCRSPTSPSRTWRCASRSIAGC